jgi:hypothetical protein
MGFLIMIIYTDKTLKNWQGGRQLWFFAIVRPEHRGKQDLIEHEKAHIKQWWLVTILTALAVGFGAFVANKHLGVTWEQLAPLVVLPPSTHALLYLTLKKYRLWAEVQAYRVSLSYRPNQLDHYANVLATKYKLRISTDQAKRLLS